VRADKDLMPAVGRVKSVAALVAVVMVSFAGVLVEHQVYLAASELEELERMREAEVEEAIMAAAEAETAGKTETRQAVEEGAPVMLTAKRLTHPLNPASIMEAERLQLPLTKY